MKLVTLSLVIPTQAFYIGLIISEDFLRHILNSNISFIMQVQFICSGYKLG